MLNFFRYCPIIICLFGMISACVAPKYRAIDMDKLFPWCIVAFDSLERSPIERIEMLKDLRFTKYAYDWRDKHLDEMAEELTLAKENEIEVISVWLWLNAKRDSLYSLSPANERIFEILKELKLQTTLWLSFSPNFFEGLTQAESISRAIEMIKVVHSKASNIGCDIALYNHRGWFGNPYNQVKIIHALPTYNLSIVYNFHHAHDYLEDFPQIVKDIAPYLSAVNLNGMHKEGLKILTIGQGDHEQEMIQLFLNEGFEGPWGILGHVENVDVEKVLIRNIKGIQNLQLDLR